MLQLKGAVSLQVWFYLVVSLSSSHEYELSHLELRFKNKQKCSC